MSGMSLMYEDAARQPDQEPGCLIGDPDALHDGHHVHQGANWMACSCGQHIGTWSVAFDGDPAGNITFWDEARCRICGQEGVLWAQDAATQAQ